MLFQLNPQCRLASVHCIVVNPNHDIEHLKEFPVSVAGDMFLLNSSMSHSVLIVYKDRNLVKKGSLKFREKHLEVEQEDDNTAEIKTINKTAENYVEMETSSEETEDEITVMKKTIITLKVKTAEHKITG